jgi:hypothetical protein
VTCNAAKETALSPKPFRVAFCLASVKYYLVPNGVSFVFAASLIAIVLPNSLFAVRLSGFQVVGTLGAK